MVKRYGERGGELKFAQRFSFQQPTQNLREVQRHFRKKVQQKEEGRSQRHYGAAAKAIERNAARAHREAHPAPAAAPCSVHNPAEVSIAARGVVNRGSCIPRGFADPERETETLTAFTSFCKPKRRLAKTPTNCRRLIQGVVRKDERPAGKDRMPE